MTVVCVGWPNKFHFVLYCVHVEWGKGKKWKTINYILIFVLDSSQQKEFHRCCNRTTGLGWKFNKRRNWNLLLAGCSLMDDSNKNQSPDTASCDRVTVLWFAVAAPSKTNTERASTNPAFSSSSSFDPDPVFVGHSASGTIFELLLLPSIVVSANLFVCAIFSIILPPAVKSDILCFLAARCFFALVRSAYEKMRKKKLLSL